MRICFIQPSIPRYRLPFFDNVIKGNKNTSILACPVDHLGVETAKEALLGGNYFINFREYKLPFGFLFQTHIFSREVYKSDVVILPGNLRYLSNFLLILVLKLLNKKIVWWGQAGRSDLSKDLRIWLINHLDGCLLYTESEKEKYKKSKSIIVSINNGLDYLEISKNRIDNRTSDKKLRLIFIGRNTEKSKLDLLLKAMERKDKDAFTLDVIGCFYETNIDGVTFHGPLHNESEIAKIVSFCDVFIYPGDVGLSISHAFCYGLPAIIHNDFDSHMPEAVVFEQGVNGYVFEKDDIDSLINVLDDVLEDKSNGRLRMLSLNCEEKVKNEYNTNVMAKRFFSMLDALKNES
ncbi:glycosyltransferase [Vibrio vulnificus]|nr:glycosyltransferase [Vibrio vulnificus]